MFERCVFFNSNALVRKLNQRWEHAYSELNIAPSHGCFLRLVLQNPGMTQTEICEALVLEKSTVARFVDKLMHDGWVTRIANKDDKRQKCVHPTEKLHDIEPILLRISDDLYDEMKGILGSDELNEFVTLIRKYSQFL